MNIVQAIRKSKTIDEYNQIVDELEKMEIVIKELQQQKAQIEEHTKVAERFEATTPPLQPQPQLQANNEQLVEQIAQLVLQKLQDLNKQRRGI